MTENATIADLIFRIRAANLTSDKLDALIHSISMWEVYQRCRLKGQISELPNDYNQKMEECVKLLSKYAPRGSRLVLDILNLSIDALLDYLDEIKFEKSGGKSPRRGKYSVVELITKIEASLLTSSELIKLGKFVNSWIEINGAENSSYEEIQKSHRVEELISLNTGVDLKSVRWVLYREARSLAYLIRNLEDTIEVRNKLPKGYLNNKFVAEIKYKLEHAPLDDDLLQKIENLVSSWMDLSRRSSNPIEALVNDFTGEKWDAVNKISKIIAVDPSSIEKVLKLDGNVMLYHLRQLRNSNALSKSVPLDGQAIGSFGEQAGIVGPLAVGPEEAYSQLLAFGVDERVANDLRDEWQASGTKLSAREVELVARTWAIASAAQARAALPEKLARLVPKVGFMTRPDQTIGPIAFYLEYWTAAISAGATIEQVESVDRDILPAMLQEKRELEAKGKRVPKFKWPKSKASLGVPSADIDPNEARAYVERQKANARARSARYRMKNNL